MSVSDARREEQRYVRAANPNGRGKEGEGLLNG